MPLIKSKSKPAFKKNVETLMGEVGKSPHVQSQKQALAIAYSVKRRGRAEGGAVEYDPLSGVPITPDYDRTEPEAAPNVAVRNAIATAGKTLGTAGYLGGSLAKRVLWDLPHEQVEAGRIPYGLRREDFTDVPANPSPEPDPESYLSKLGIKVPAGQGGHLDPLISGALESGLNVMGGTAFSAPAGAMGAGITPRVRAALPRTSREYPIAPKGEWHGDANYETTGGQMVRMSPDEYISKVRPLQIDDVSRENIDALKRHIEEGRTLDPLAIYRGGKEDGRHRAYAAKELGIGEVPVLTWPDRGKVVLGAGAADKRAAGVAAVDDILAQERKLADPFYSHLDQSLKDIKQPSMTGEQWMGTLRNQGVKPDELDWRGVSQFLDERKGQPVTKAELEQHLAGNNVELKPVEYGTPPKFEDLTAAQQDHIVENFRERYGTNPTRDEMREWYEGMNEGKEVFGKPNTRYESYQLPGGENYRERLLTLPSSKSNDRLRELELKRVGGQPMTQAEREEYHSLRDQGVTDQNVYRSSHWDEPNVVVHRRTNDRDVGGKPSLHLEELQSDLHQQGRKSGYIGTETPAQAALIKERDVLAEKAVERQNNVADYGKDPAYIEAMDRITAINEELRQPFGDTRPPNMPFKKNWHDLALKDAIREAAEKGMDRISWTPGEAQAARYDLSKHVEAIRANKNPDGTYQIGTKKPGHNMARPTREMRAVPADKLEDFVGKELAEKIIKGEGGVADEYGRVYSGLDLKVGGAGMKGFYDKILVDAANKIGKSHGVKVQKTNIRTAKENKLAQKLKENDYDPDTVDAQQILTDNGGRKPRWLSDEELEAIERNEHQEFLGIQQQPIWYMDIPKSLKEQALYKGFPKHAAGGAVKAYQDGGAVPGLMTPGNIDLTRRPVHRNLDGLISTVRSISQDFGKGEVLMPTVGHDGTILSNDDAARLYKLSGKHLGIFDTPTNADAYAQQLHLDQEKMYRKRGGKVDAAMQIARDLKRASGGKVHVGPIVGDTGGRADKVPMKVPNGCYVITSDVCSSLGENNTLAGFEKLKKMFPKSKPSLMRNEPGEKVDILAADGEYIISPSDILDRWGDLDTGHRILDKWQMQQRAHHIQTLKGLSPPAQD